MPASRSRSGARKDGYIPTIHEAGFNGTVDTTSDGECPRRTLVRSNAGKQSAVTFTSFSLPASPVICGVADGKDRRSCIGRTTAGNCRNSSTWQHWPSEMKTPGDRNAVTTESEAEQSPRIAEHSYEGDRNHRPHRRARRHAMKAQILCASVLLLLFASELTRTCRASVRGRDSGNVKKRLAMTAISDDRNMREPAL